MTQPLGSQAGAAGGRSGPREAPPGRAKGLSGKLQVQDTQAWAERKPRAKERAFPPAPPTPQQPGVALWLSLRGAEGRFIPALAHGCA